MHSEKKAYLKPESKSEKIFEQNALTCSKCSSIHQLMVIGACARGATKKS